MKPKRFIATLTASAFVFVGTAGIILSPNQINNANADIDALPEISQPELPEDSEQEENIQTEEPQTETPVLPEIPAEPEPEPEPQIQTVKYIKITGEGVNLRSGAGTEYAVKGVAEKNTLYAYLDSIDGWYKLYYKNSVVYVSNKFCTVVEMEKSQSEKVEQVIADGTRYMGVKYVYGAVRYHDGSGKVNKGFTTSAFDCSSLMQYIFYTGARRLLNVNTRTQVYQGKTVNRSQLQRGDLIFFTNASRKNNTGVERIGHVALYLGDNYILHTSSDYAKIEKISSERWGYYVQAQRML